MLPASEYLANAEGYETLSCMEPDNKIYQKKASDYNKLAKEAHQKSLEFKKSAWTVFESTDEMTGKTSVYLSSENGTTTRPMDFPYTGTRSSINLGCNANDIWSYFWFSSKPNISNDLTESGYSRSKSRIRFDNTLDTISLTQEWGSKFMHVTYENWFIDKLKQRKTVKLELNWHAQNNTIFEYNVHGFVPAYTNFKQKCSKL